MISASVQAIEDRANLWAEMLGAGDIIAGLSTVGGGSLPGETLPTSLYALEVRSPNAFTNHLRISADPPVIARLQDDRVVFDPRTVLPEQDEALLYNVKGFLG